MKYTGTKKVREHNGQQFIDDFRRCRGTIVCYVMATGDYFAVLRMDVWQKALQGKVHYMILNEVYKVKRDTIVIV